MYIYAFLKTPTSPLKLPQGIKGSLEIISDQGLSALVEPNLQAEDLPDTDEQLMQAVVTHDQITCTIFHQTSLLPVRFGTCFRSKTALLEHLVLYQQNYFNKLDQLEGKAEYCLQGVPLDPPANTLTQTNPTDLTPLRGRDYFLAKKQLHHHQLQQQQQQTQQWQQLLEVLCQTYPETYLADSQPNRERIYILMQQSNESKLQEQLKQWQSQYTHWQLSLGNAVPPYHFL
ncbi:GvpL/GvpF family gas vesicle protein [Planktothrix mougeotii]|uniref:GvpL/GvpF family gas vesicle protein n=1 Tax=Planktothrix mougeotii LEGE 06226 TaxID=1828728 RepID=A0ABR9UDL9_9CYAN|nr:GvpL/GvpF family gas vesicle protein [Planktothrix mougeotii]MBE9144562.1 GvpL/GvpF family gas vesicle protein [Planktothrix mougeotii LEGE 06226]